MEAFDCMIDVEREVFPLSLACVYDILSDSSHRLKYGIKGSFGLICMLGRLNGCRCFYTMIWACFCLVNHSRAYGYILVECWLHLDMFWEG